MQFYFKCSTTKLNVNHRLSNDFMKVIFICNDFYLVHNTEIKCDGLNKKKREGYSRFLSGIVGGVI